ncbi:hypothetical protein L3X38_031005 [Prunus dulcis]|uniref:Uncharacterized protein n=1 Tax=Prunus dulcis TaxID=3755 RepID=A0AAD4VBP3_PRUDU|nr:hypothetical protein L3X38_031005 [Prunus dulcis]
MALELLDVVVSGNGSVASSSSSSLSASGIGMIRDVGEKRDSSSSYYGFDEALGEEASTIMFFSTSLGLGLAGSTTSFRDWLRFLWMTRRGTSFQVQLQTGQTRLSWLCT